MIKTILKLAVILIIGILVYNYFWGNPEERETSEKVFNEIKDVGIAVKDFVQEEHARIKEGKYDRVLDRIKETLSDVESTVDEMDEESKEEFRELKNDREVLEKEVEEAKDSGEELTKEEKDTIERRLEDLLDKTKDFLENHK